MLPHRSSNDSAYGQLTAYHHRRAQIKAPTYYAAAQAEIDRLRAEPSETYGPLINLIQDMWSEHDERAQGSCACKACKAGTALFDALFDAHEVQR